MKNCVIEIKKIVFYRIESAVQRQQMRLQPTGQELSRLSYFGKLVESWYQLNFDILFHLFIFIFFRISGRVYHITNQLNWSLS